jgi:hypothetical protein
LALGLGWCAGVRGGSLTAAIDPQTVRLGESAKLSLIFENCQASVAPVFPNVPGLQFAYAGQSSSFQLANGKQTAVQTLSYFVTASKAGDYVIPPIVAPVGNDRLTTEPLRLKVVKADEKLPDGEAQGQLAFLKLAVPKTQVYVGEVLPVEIQLYLVSGQDLQMQPLGGEGFTFGKVQQLPQRQVQIGGMAYFLVALKTTATANKAGSLELGPAECRVTLRIPAARRRSRDPFEDFFNDPFGSRYELRPTRLASDPVKIQVLPLPAENRPETFAGSVGEFALNVTASPTNIAVGDPIRVRVQVSGKGALEAINLKPLDGSREWREFTTYPPTTQVESTDPLGIEGSKTFQFDVVPQSTGVRALPALAFSYFDPVRKAYRTLGSAATPILVRPAGTAPLLAPAVTNRVGTAAAAPPPQDIVAAKQRPGAVGPIAAPLLHRGWFVGLQAVPALVLAAAVAWRKRREHLARNPQVLRRAATQRFVRQGLDELSRLAAGNDPDAFFALVFHMLQEQIGERLDLPAAAITEASIEDQLRLRGASDDLCRCLHELFGACNQQRYAPGAGRADLPAFVPTVREALAQLQAVPTAA